MAYLTLKGVSKAQLPSQDIILAEAKNLLGNLEEWQKSKLYKKPVNIKEIKGGNVTVDIQTFKRTYQGEHWALRQSKHPQSLFPLELFTKGLFENHTLHESEYIDMVKGIEDSEKADNWDSFKVRYKFPLPLKDRVMNFWIICIKEAGVYYIITIPRDWENSEPLNAVKGVYCSVERLRLVGDNVEWTMGTASDARGFLPKTVQNWSVETHILPDVPLYLEWAVKKFPEVSGMS